MAEDISHPGAKKKPGKYTKIITYSKRTHPKGISISDQRLLEKILYLLSVFKVFDLNREKKVTAI